MLQKMMISLKKYQSVHLIYYNKHNPDCCYEDQIRTPDMEFIAKRDTLIGHYNYKPIKLGKILVYVFLNILLLQEILQQGKM